MSKKIEISDLENLQTSPLEVTTSAPFNGLIHIKDLNTWDLVCVSREALAKMAAAVIEGKL